jgi:hypothetical protein
LPAATVLGYLAENGIFGCLIAHCPCCDHNPVIIAQPCSNHVPTVVIMISKHVWQQWWGHVQTWVGRPSFIIGRLWLQDEILEPLEQKCCYFLNLQ